MSDLKENEGGSVDDGLLAKGRVVAEYEEAKARLAQLKSTALPLISKLNALANQLNHYESAPVNYDLAFLQTNFQALMTNLQTTARDKSRLEGKLHDLGIDVRTGN